MNIFDIIPETITCKGIIQVGANIGQELSFFKTIAKNILIFEPIKKCYDDICNNHPDVIAYNIALGSKTERKKMHIASNNYESSSFLSPKKHLEYYPNIKFQLSDDIDIMRFDCLDIDMSKYNILFSDTQGYELDVLAGFGNKLSSIDAICVEYIDSDLYENNNTGSVNIMNFLNDFDFNLIKKIEEANGWGNLIFAKKQYL